MSRLTQFSPLLILGAVLTAPSGLGAQEFRRGDANGDGCVDVADAEYITDAIFGEGEWFRCEDAADADDSGTVEFNDATYIQQFIQLDGPPPAPPFPFCGPDRHDDRLSCLEYESCDVNCGEETLFIRADSNGDGTVTITDPIFTLGFLFSGSRGPDCEDAADANDDGQLDLSDAIFTLICLFGGGACPDRFQECVADPTPDGLAECETGC